MAREPKAVERVVRALEQRFGNRVVTSRAMCEQHGHTTTWIATEPPDAVAFPQGAADVVEIVRICAAERLPVIPFGAARRSRATSTRLEGGVSIDFRR